LIVAVAYPSAGSGGEILRYTYSGSSWSVTPISQYVPAFQDMVTSPDGKNLIALSSTAVSLFDSLTLASGPITNATDLFAGFEYLRYSAMTNDGKMLITSGVFGSGDTVLRSYDLRSTSFSKVGSYPTNYVYFGTPSASLDGSRVVVVQGGTSPPSAVLQYDASTGGLSLTGTNLNIGAAALDRTGSRIVLNGSLVFNKSFVQIGSIPCGYMQTVLAPDGSRAYCYGSNLGNTLHTYDLSVPPVAGVFPEIGAGITLASNPGALSKMAISPDGGTLFIAGSSRIVVQPLP
jgi:hypothetical protein